MNITDPNEPYFKDGIWGWDGTAWHRLPMVWGYSAQYAQNRITYNATAGIYNLDYPAVDPDEVWVVTNLMAWNDITAPTYVYWEVRIGAASHYVFAVVNPGLRVGVGGQVNLVLKEGDLLRCAFHGCAAGDDLYTTALGYKMLIAE